MKKEDIFWSAIKNGYAKTITSEDDLRTTILKTIQKDKEQNISTNLNIVHSPSKTKIQICKDENGKYTANIVK